MPIYRFHLELPVTTQVATERLQAVVGPRRTFGAEMKRRFGLAKDAGPPFIGSVEAGTFDLRRVIRYRNSFIPLVRGRITSAPMGSRVDVTMSLHPVVAVFMALWILGTGLGALAMLDAPSAQERSTAMLLLTMLALGVVLVVGGFFPEAAKARRLLERALAGVG